MKIERVIGGAALALVVACAGTTPDHTPQVVPAAAPPVKDGATVVARYWVQASPSTGTMEMYPLHEGNVIYPDEGITVATSFNYGGAVTQDDTCTPGATCLPPTDTVHLFTPQTTVSYVEGTLPGDTSPGTCHSNGVTFPGDSTCGGLYPAGHPCTVGGTFCGKVQMTSNLAFGGAVGAMPDVIVDVADDPMTPSVAGCVNDTGKTFGLCADDGPAKITAGTSNFVPSLPGDGVTTKACAYCYGNKTAATTAGKAGLVNAVLSGNDASLLAIDTDEFALRLTNANSFNVTLTVFYANATLNPAGSQMKVTNNSGTPLACYNPASSEQVRIFGGGFGPPGACLTGSPPASCPASGAPGAGYRVSLPGLTSPLPISGWSDTLLQTGSLALGLYGCGATITTPHSPDVVTTDEIKVCGNTWRSWLPLNQRSVVGAAIGVLNDTIVIAGGRTSLTNGGTQVVTVRGIPVPRCSNALPDAANMANMPSARWGAASTVASNGLYVIGGAISASACNNAVFRLPSAAGAWATMASLPDTDLVTAGNQGLCQGSAVDLVDQTNGKEYIVVMGGITNRPLPGTGAATLTLNKHVFVYDVAANTWTRFANAVAKPRYNMGAAAFNDPANPANNKALFATGSPSTLTTGSPPVSVDTNVVTLSGGTPTIVAGPSVISPRSMPGMTVLNGVFYLVGGNTSVLNDTALAGNNGIFSIPASPLGTWSSSLQKPAHARGGGGLVVAAFNEPVFTDLARLISVGGFDGATYSSNVDEYNP
jgi:hypothetical protein